MIHDHHLYPASSSVRLVSFWIACLWPFHRLIETKSKTCIKINPAHIFKNEYPNYHVFEPVSPTAISNAFSSVCCSRKREGGRKREIERERKRTKERESEREQERERDVNRKFDPPLVTVYPRLGSRHLVVMILDISSHIRVLDSNETTYWNRLVQEPSVPYYHWHFLHR